MQQKWRAHGPLKNLATPHPVGLTFLASLIPAEPAARVGLVERPAYWPSKLKHIDGNFSVRRATANIPTGASPK